MVDIFLALVQNDVFGTSAGSGNEVVLSASIGASVGTLSIDASLNSDSVTTTFYEDATGDGSADTSEQFTVLDGNNDYSLSSGFSLGTGSEVWYDVEAEDDGSIPTAMTKFDLTLNF